MGLTKRSVMMAVCLALGLAPAVHASAELSPTDADRYLTARADIARLKGEATKAYQDGEAKFNAKDIAGACGDLQTSADKFGQMASAEDVIISLSGNNAGSAQMHKDEQASQRKARDMVLATMAKVCPAASATGAADTNSDALHARYDSDMADYQALNKAANDHLGAAQNATDITVKCREYKADLGSMRDGQVKMDEMIAILKEAHADPAEMVTTKTNNQAALAQVQAIYESSCAGR